MNCLGASAAEPHRDEVEGSARALPGGGGAPKGGDSLMCRGWLDDGPWGWPTRLGLGSEEW